MPYHVPHWIGGQAVIDTPHSTAIPITNPALGETIGFVASASEARVHEAVTAAKTAWPHWVEMPVIKRAQIFHKFRALLEENQSELAILVTKEHGKTIDDAKGSVARAIEVVAMYSGLLHELQSTFSADVSSGIDSYTLRQPLGVCAGISPFNFPVMVPVWMIVPALACGNAFVLKPSEQTPSATVRLCELLQDAGLPPGVVNCLQGGRETASHLLMHPEVAAVTAVASSPVAEMIYKTAIAEGKRAHTFGSAKNHALVMPDANFRQAANALVGAAFGSAGERCMAISVIVAVGDETAERLIDGMRPLIEAIRIDAGDVPGADMGPLVSLHHKQRVLHAIESGLRAGARLLIDGRTYQHPRHPQGFFLGPSLFDGVDTSMSIYQEEIFGPVLILMRVPHFEAGLDLINQNPYGNGCAIFTKDGYTAREFGRRVQVGMVGVNIPIPVPIASHPFGGWKRSVFGDINMHGLESIQFYTKRKTVTTKWPVNTLTQSVFNMPTHG